MPVIAARDRHPGDRRHGMSELGIRTAIAGMPIARSITA